MRGTHIGYRAHRAVIFAIAQLSCLADRTATQYHRHHPVVRQSVCPSVTLCILALRVGVQG